MNTLTDAQCVQQAHQNQLQHIDRAVLNVRTGDEHALGAFATHLEEEKYIVADNVFNATQELLQQGMSYADIDAHKQVHRDSVISDPDAPHQSDNEPFAVRKLQHEASWAHKNKKDLKEELDDVRIAIAERTKNDPSFAGLTLKDLPPFLRHVYKKECVDSDGTPTRSVTEWLTEASEAGDKRLINFVKYNTDRHEKLQHDPELNEALDRLKKDWLAAVEKGVVEGWLHPNAAFASQRMKLLQVVFADYYDLQAHNREAYAKPYDYIVVLPTHVDGIDVSGSHELNHALLGHHLYKWLNEAVTEHIAQVFDGNRTVDDISSVGILSGTQHPQPEHDDRFYRSERNLLAAIIEGSKGKLTVSDFTRMYSNNTYQRPNADELRAFYAKIDDAYQSEAFIMRLNTFLTYTYRSYVQAGMQQLEAWQLANADTAALLVTNPDEIVADHKQHERL